MTVAEINPSCPDEDVTKTASDAIAIVAVCAVAARSFASITAPCEIGYHIGDALDVANSMLETVRGRLEILELREDVRTHSPISVRSA